MLKVNVEKSGLNNIDKVIKKISYINSNSEYINFIKNKVSELLEQVMNERLGMYGNTTNDDEIALYRGSNHFEDTENGFILYNDAKIPADKYNTLPFDTSGYPNGQFSIAMAFEYGTGIVGESHIDAGAWVFNDISSSKSVSHKRKKISWYLPKNVYGESHIWSEGYQGMEIYRTIANKFRQNINKWTKEYLERGVNND